MMQMQYQGADQAPETSQKFRWFPGLEASSEYFLQSQHSPLDTPLGCAKMTQEKLATAGGW